MRYHVEVDKEILPKVLKVLDLVIDFKKAKRKPTYCKDIFGASISNPKCKRVIRQCINSTVSCIASHRYNEAVSLLRILTQDKGIDLQFLFKSIMIVLMNLEFSEKAESIWSCFKAFKGCIKINKRELQLEQVMYALRSNTNEHQISEGELNYKSNYRKCAKIESTLEAYMALMKYMELSSYGLSSQSSQSTKQTIQLIFEKSIKESGDWDIFVLQLLKIMHCGFDSENPVEINSQIEDLLLNYINSNPDNINAYIYLCAYLYHYNHESKNLENYLKVIAEMDPSDARVLWLLEILDRQKIDLTERLKYIFMYLDYPSNKKNITAWRILKQNLFKASSNEDMQSIQSLWETRSRSWEWMHFNPLNVHDLELEDRELLLQKVHVLSFFCHKHKFIKKVKKMFPEIKERDR